MLWEVDIHPAEGQPDILAREVAASVAELGIASNVKVHSARGYLLQGNLNREQIERLSEELLADLVVEHTVVAPMKDAALVRSPHTKATLIHVLLKPGVMDPVALSTQAAIADFGMKADIVRTVKKFWVEGISEDRIPLLCSKVLSNDAIEQAIVGPLTFDHLDFGSAYQFKLTTVPIRAMDDAALQKLSLQGQLYLSLVEMQTIRDYFKKLERDPTDVELETVAQTWSEHCSHKTLAGRIHYRDGQTDRHFQNMLKETIFASTQQIRKNLGEKDWCVSVFADNAGVIRFDEKNNVVFKVETHNHPSALEPYGGANTGIGGVIRDPMGTGMGAKPICNTDVFCFAPPDTSPDDVPPGALHPRRVMKGVVSGVRDYGNRMGIPTVNGAIYFDPRYLGNPLVYCGNIGIIPCDQSFKHQQPGDYIVAVGGRTGRDGIHGATFSSAELTSQSETISGGAVQIGNAITEKMVLDVMLVARDRGLYNAVTDCGAGGFSSAVGEMGEKIGAEVNLDSIPLKYEGLSYTEMWISEAQERMVLSVPHEKWKELSELCASEGVEATIIGTFKPTGRLKLLYKGQQVADLAMEFLHDGRPPVVRDAIYTPPAVKPLTVKCAAGATAASSSACDKGATAGLSSSASSKPTANCQPSTGNSVSPTPGPCPLSPDYTQTVLKILGSLNVCSKEWVIRQYDHEVQGGSALKPLVGVANDGPGDASVVRPVIDSRRGIVVSCGMNPCYGEFDTYWMAASAIDEAIRNAVAVGADPDLLAILDNFCWGTTDRPETLGSLVRAALACHDMAIAFGTPFISGKDSLNNEFRPKGADEPISIPPSLLISALGQVDDVAKCVSMDFKRAGNAVYVVGLTKNELGGSHYAMVEGLEGGAAPQVDPATAKKIFAAMHSAIQGGLVRACHDLSEGGLATGLAEMAFAGGLGAKVDLSKVLCAEDVAKNDSAVLLFSESNTRFVCEIEPAKQADFEKAFAGLAAAKIGEVTDTGELEIACGGKPVVKSPLSAMKEAWQKPLKW